MSMRSATGANERLVSAIARALGGRSASVIATGSALPPAERSGFLGRNLGHLLVVDIPNSRPPRQLVVSLRSAPTTQDHLVAEALVRSFEAPKSASGPAGATWDPSPAMRALEQPAAKRAEAFLRAALIAARSRSGALVITNVPPGSWVLGGDKDVMRQAALKGASEHSTVETSADSKILIMPVVWQGSVVGGFAAEAGVDSPGLRACLALAGAVLRPDTGPDPEPADPPIDAEAVYHAVFSLVGLPVLALGPSGRLVAASPLAETLFALTDFDIGRPMRGRLSDIAVDEVLSGRVPSEVRADESSWKVTSAPTPDGGVLLQFADMSAQAAVVAHQDSLVAAMSHELRTPIAGVKALLEVLKILGPRGDPEKLTSLISEGIKEIGRLERLVEDLLLTARVATGGITPHSDRIELRPVVDSVVSHLAPRYPEARVKVNGAAAAFADPSLVRHAVWHLLDNAIKFGPPNGEVVIEISRADHRARVSVTDSGPGIFSGEMAELFQRFHRAEKNSKSQHGGAGVGLYLTKEVIEAQGGQVTVQTRMSKGSTFTFELPSPDDENRD